MIITEKRAALVLTKKCADHIIEVRGADVSRLRSEILLSGTLEPDTGNAVVGN